MNENRIYKVLIFCMIALLAGAIFGLVNSFELLRWDILSFCILFAVVAFSSRRYYWGVLFLGFGILFNPIMPFYIGRALWIVADAALLLSLLFWLYDYFASYHKGLVFEKFVRDRFPDSEWIIVTATKDLHKKLRRFVESDANPDFVFRRRTTGKEIAVECKYRSQFAGGSRGDEGLWWKSSQGERYARYGERNNIPVYIAFGIEGNPKSPKTIAYIPLSTIHKQYPRFIPREVFEHYSEIPTGN